MHKSAAESRVHVAINYRSAMQPSYLGCRFRAGTVSRTCGFDISQTFRQMSRHTASYEHICVYLYMSANLHMHLSLSLSLSLFLSVNMCMCTCAYTVASGIYTNSLSHYVEHFCSSYRKRYSLATSISQIPRILSLPPFLALFQQR